MTHPNHPDTVASNNAARAETVVQVSTNHGQINLAPAPAAEALVEPMQIPPGGQLHDRHEVRALLAEHATRPGALLVITGPPGIGKTLLASRIVAQRDGPRLYVDLGDIGPAASMRSATGIRAGWLHALGVPTPLIPDHDADSRGLWHSVTARRDVAVLIDGATSAEQVVALRSVGGLTIVTSRSPLLGLLGDGAHHITLPPLELPAAVELLRDALARAARPPAVADESSVTVLAAACDGLPLTLHLAAATAASQPDRPLRAFVDDFTRPAGTSQAAPPASALEGPVSHARRNLTLKPENAWQLLSLIEPDFGLAEAAALLGTDRPEALQTLTALCGARLLELTRDDGTTGPARWRIPGALVLAARGLLAQEDPAERDLAMDRLLAWVLPAAEFAAACASPYRPWSQRILTTNRHNKNRPELDGPRALAWLTDHHQIIAACVRTAEKRRDWTLVIALAATLWPLALHHLLDPRIWWRVDDAALRAADALEDDELTARVLDRLGIWARRTGHHALAVEYHTRAAARWTMLRRPGRYAESIRRIGHVALAQGAPDRALRLFEEAVTVFTDLDTDRGHRLAGLTRVDIATAYLAAVRTDSTGSDTVTAALDALESAERGHELITDHAPRDTSAQARALLVMGQAAARLGQPDAAGHLREALALANQAGAVPVQVAVLDELAALLRRDGAEAEADEIAGERDRIATGLRS